jgi:4-hydroxyphenylpyruvate dioxygenase
MTEHENPMGTDGFEFVEYTAPDPKLLGALFEQMGFTAVARHRSKDVLLYRQGQVNFIVNREADSFAQSFARVHGPSACAFAMRVKDAAKAYKRALELGAKPYHGPSARWSSTSRHSRHRRQPHLPRRPLPGK